MRSGQADNVCARGSFLALAARTASDNADSKSDVGRSGGDDSKVDRRERNLHPRAAGSLLGAGHELTDGGDPDPRVRLASEQSESGVSGQLRRKDGRRTSMAEGQNTSRRRLLSVPGNKWQMTQCVG